MNSKKRKIGNSKSKRLTNVSQGESFETFEDDHRIDLAIIPGALADSDVESDEDSDTDDEVRIAENEKLILSYSKIYENYSTEQKLLEPAHEYSWVAGEKQSHGHLENENLLKTSDHKSILKSTPTEIFEFYFADNIKNYIIEASSENDLELTRHDLDIFIGIVIVSTFNKRTSERDYWSTNRLLECPIVRSAMPRDKFLRIKSALKCSKKQDEDPSDPAWRVRKIFNLFRENIKRFGFFQTALSIDEMMIKFYGRLKFKQFIKNKPVRFGIKMWALCGADGYLFDCDIYCGKNSVIDKKLGNCALGSRVVLKMLQGLLFSSTARKLDLFHVYFDNFFCNPDVLVHLSKIGLKGTGTVRRDRVKEKNDLDKKSPRGSYVVKHDSNSELVYITVMDSKPVSLLSTAVGIEPLKPAKRYSGEHKAKIDIAMPHAIATYNKYMGGVDLQDQYCSTLLPTFRSKKWTWPVLMRVLQSSISNAVIISNLVNSGKKKFTAKEFAMSIAEDYLLKPNSTDLASHKKCTHENKKTCSDAKCAIRTHLYCAECDRYFCKMCFQRFHEE